MLFSMRFNIPQHPERVRKLQMAVVSRNSRNRRYALNSHMRRVLQRAPFYLLPEVKDSSEDIS